jgi:hypothetical protein
MPAPQFRENFYQGRRAAATVSAVNTSFTTTGLATVKAPASGRTLRVFAIRIQAYVTTVLAGATAGDPILAVDNVIGTPVIEFRFQNSTTATRAGQGGYIVTATDAVTVHYGWCENDWGLSGLKLGAADNALKVGCANTITTGVIAIRGWVLTSDE